MKEANTLASADEPREVTDPVDDNTRQVVDEYSRKFLSFIQQEKEKVRKQAQAESERTVIEAEKKAKFIYDKAVEDAKAEAQRITEMCGELATQVLNDGRQISEAIDELRERTEGQLESLRSRLQHEANAIVEYMRQSDSVVEEARQRLSSEFASSSRLVADLLEKLKSSVPQGQEETKPAAARGSNSKDDDVGEPVTGKGARQDGRRHADKTFVGTLNFDVYKGSAALSRRFKDALSKVPDLEISVADDSAKDRTKIVAFANRPLPILSILHQMSMVKSVVADQSTIEVVLQEADNWIG